MGTEAGFDQGMFPCPLDPRAAVNTLAAHFSAADLGLIHYLLSQLDAVERESNRGPGRPHRTLMNSRPTMLQRPGTSSPRPIGSHEATRRSVPPTRWASPTSRASLARAEVGPVLAKLS
jgi:hypothetical protein